MGTELKPISRYAARTLTMLFNRWHLHTSAPVYGSGRRRGILLRWTNSEPPFESRNIPASVVDTLEQAGYIYARLASRDHLTVLYDLTSAARTAQANIADRRGTASHSAPQRAPQQPSSAPSAVSTLTHPTDPLQP